MQPNLNCRAIWESWARMGKLKVKSVDENNDEKLESWNFLKTANEA